jgi:hypothetical protein
LPWEEEDALLAGNTKLAPGSVPPGRLIVELSARTVDLLRVLGDPTEVLQRLADHAQQGVYRPGAWERDWIVQAFGDEFLDLLEQDPEAPYFQRPKATE